MSAHTPGPWRVEMPRSAYDEIGGDFVISYTDADGAEWDIASLEPGRASRRADAILIAAAPDLAAALREIEALITNIDNMDRCQQAALIARRAIEKARAW